MLSVSINAIRFTGINSGRLLLENIRFELKPGEILTILGKNGSGKSTLIKSLTGLLDKKFYSIDGKAFFHGENILELPEEKLLYLRKNKIKYVFQDASNSFDPLKKLKYYFDRVIDHKKEFNPLLEYFLLPNSNELNKLYPYEISGGMAQRTALVLSLLADPELLILDEPTSGIDPAVANLMLLKLKDFVSNGNSVLLVTQDLIFAKKISSKVSLLADRSISGFCEPAEFFKSKEYQHPGFRLHK
ncbi:MAG TPA: ATP-binding cassette domain-containing protein [Ignavibacteriaceae bacterium]|nr:ATP-binding cassette domain-containing protein [Ignavibacteriaceae bacterium]